MEREEVFFSTRFLRAMLPRLRLRERRRRPAKCAALFLNFDVTLLGSAFFSPFAAALGLAASLVVAFSSSLQVLSFFKATSNSNGLFTTPPCLPSFLAPSLRDRLCNPFFFSACLLFGLIGSLLFGLNGIAGSLLDIHLFSCLEEASFSPAFAFFKDDADEVELAL